MGVSTSPEQLVAKLQRSAQNVKRAQKDTLKGSGQIVKVRVLSQAAGEIGGDLSFGGKKKVGASYRLSESSVMVKATGPFHWLERGVQPHAIAPKSAGGSRAARSSFVAQAFGSGPISFGRGRIGVLKFASGEFRPYARRAGRFAARRSWSKGVSDAEPLVRRRFLTGTGNAFLAPFR
jgi:hypothetical protein